MLKWLQHSGRSAHVVITGQPIVRILRSRPNICAVKSHDLTCCLRRRGRGRIPFLDVEVVWVQQKARDGIVDLEKLVGAKNPADFFTNYVQADIFNKAINKHCIPSTQTTALTQSPIITIALAMVRALFVLRRGYDIDMLFMLAA